jgi:hypothetical protein
MVREALEIGTTICCYAARTICCYAARTFTVRVASRKGSLRTELK